MLYLSFHFLFLLPFLQGLFPGILLLFLRLFPFLLLLPVLSSLLLFPLSFLLSLYFYMLPAFLHLLCLSLYLRLLSVLCRLHLPDPLLYLLLLPCHSRLCLSFLRTYSLLLFRLPLFLYMFHLYFLLPSFCTRMSVPLPIPALLFLLTPLSLLLYLSSFLKTQGLSGLMRPLLFLLSLYAPAIRLWLQGLRPSSVNFLLSVLLCLYLKNLHRLHIYRFCLPLQGRLSVLQLPLSRLYLFCSSLLLPL